MQEMADAAHATASATEIPGFGSEAMRVANAMTRGAHLIKASDTVKQAAKLMAEEDVGFLPVEENDRLVGTITDRDIVVRCLAKGGDGDARVRDAMTKDIKYCFEDEEMEHVITNMAEIQVRRLPVMNRKKRLVGVITLADAALNYSPESAGGALSEICTPS
jgi:CBS domain-containing protein